MILLGVFRVRSSAPNKYNNKNLQQFVTSRTYRKILSILKAAKDVPVIAPCNLLPPY